MRCLRWQSLLLLVLLSMLMAVPVYAEEMTPNEDVTQDVKVDREASPEERTAVAEEMKQAAEAIKSEDTSDIQFSGTYTLKEAVEKALADNPSIEAARRGATSAEESRKAARGAFGPALSTTYAASHTDNSVFNNHSTYQWAVDVTQPIFTGFRILATYNSAALNAQSQDLALSQAELNLIFLVQQNFINLLSARENVESAKDSVERLASQLKVAQAFYDVGLKPRIDVLRAEAQLSEAEDTLISAQNEVVIQEARLNTLLNLPVNAHINYKGELAYFPFEQPLEVSLDTAAHYRPDILIARKATEISQENVTIAASEFYPQIQGKLEWTKNGDSPEVNGFDNDGNPTPLSETTVGATASWSLFSWGTTYFATTSAKQTVMSNKASEASTWQEAAFEVKSRYLNIINAAKRIKVAEKTVAAAEEAYRMAVARYQAQVGTNTDVLDAQADLSSAEASLITARGDYMISVASLYNATGRKVPGLTSSDVINETGNGLEADLADDIKKDMEAERKDDPSAMN
ncbi:TolC family protein [Halodesulfovibrio marinisediminis]|uniref:Outer membrane protein n=1 Tax=Halodesulfovibrio marinisediminis DSM 17456 TaxID=1121457 RepID=A0A1N6EZE6_9BACT|nr:TolC family protein [Halodesulfovibrio marinisediminis]SIN88400.1 outer membrane protein [Halodesulfovibrio marinisediminis DSM 17456]